MRRILFLTFIFLAPLFSSFAQQDTLWLINGKKITLKEYKFIESETSIAYTTLKGKTKIIESEQIFSITNKAGQEKIYFKIDPQDPDIQSIEQMKSFVQGEYDARIQYKAPLATIGGFVVGVGSGILLAPNPIYSPIIPAAYSAVIGSTNPSVDKIKAKNPKYKDDEYYLLGYKDVAKQKRVANTLKGSIAGLLVGIVTAIIITD